MPKTKEQKKEILESLKEKIKKSKSILFTEFNGLEVKDNEALRNDLRKENGEYYVAKKTLLELAFRNFGLAGLKVKEFQGKVAVVFGYGDEVTPAKTVDKYKSQLENKIDFIGGILDGKYLSGAEVSVLAKLPSKNELYAKIVGSINAPISGLVNALAGNLRNFVYVLKAIEEKKGN